MVKSENSFCMILHPDEWATEITSFQRNIPGLPQACSHCLLLWCTHIIYSLTVLMFGWESYVFHIYGHSAISSTPASSFVPHSPILPEHASSINRALFSFQIFIMFLISLIQSNSNSDEFRFGVKLYFYSSWLCKPKSFSFLNELENLFKTMLKVYSIFRMKSYLVKI